jgi:hypothetical protein
MSLLVPPEMVKAINPSSGFLIIGSNYGSKNLKGLFYTLENRRYLANQLYSLLINHEFVLDAIQSIDKTLTADTLRTGAKQSVGLVNQFKPIKPIIEQRIQVLIEGWRLPAREDHAIKNPIMELSLVNQEFLVTSAKTIIQSPDCIINDYYNLDPNTNQVDAPEWDYGAASWADGTWHPEHLFTQNKRNSANVYWTPTNITIDTNPPPGDDWKKYGSRPTAFHPRAQHYKPDRAKVVQPTKRQYSRREDFTERPNISAIQKIDPNFVDVPNIQDLLEEQSYPYIGIDGFSKTYNVASEVYAPGPGPGNRYKYDFYGKGGFSGGGTFPRWQYSVNDRPYEKNNKEGLREGGSSDRRVQRPNGYDMSALTTKSYY